MREDLIFGWAVPVVNILDYNIVEDGFKLQSPYYVHIWLEKVWTLLSLQAMG